MKKKKSSFYFTDPIEFAEWFVDHKRLKQTADKLIQLLGIEKITDKMNEYNELLKQSKQTGAQKCAKSNGKNQQIITFEQATEIRNLYNSGNYSQEALATIYGFKNSFQISQIINNKTYVDDSFIKKGKNHAENIKLTILSNFKDKEFTINELTNFLISNNYKQKELAIKYARNICSKYCYRLNDKPPFIHKVL
jgi:hypothetical protein